MRFMSFTLVIFYICSIALSVFNNIDNQSSTAFKNKISGISFSKTVLATSSEGQYYLHKEKIDTEIELLKKKYPELKKEIISYKFLFAPKQGYKQFFETDGSIFVVLKIYTKHTKPGDMITISDLKYKETADSNAELKNFDTKLLFVFE